MASSSDQTFVDLLKTIQQGPAAPAAASGTTSPYVGNVPHATIRVPSPVHLPFGDQTVLASGYKKGDQFALLPTNGQDLATLQQALVQAGYLNQGDVIYGSPDAKTLNAFEQLLATANLSGTSWQNALGARLAASAQQPPATKQVPPLTVNLTNPEDIKAVANNVAKTLNGTYLNDQDLQAIVDSFHQQESAAQTQAYYQQYNPTAGGYGPGGTTVNAPSQAGLEQDISQKIRDTKPNEVAANDFTANLNTILSTLTQNATRSP